MITGKEIIISALQDFGCDAEINGDTLRVIPPRSAVRDMCAGGAVDHAGPWAMAAESDVDAMGIMAGNDGDTLTIDGMPYTVLTILPDGTGWTVLNLERH